MAKKPVVKPVAKPAAKPAAKPVAKPAAKPVAKPAKRMQVVLPPRPLSQRKGASSRPAIKPAIKPITSVEQAASEQDAPHIECRLLIGDLSLTIDAASLERTLGTGRWGQGLGLVDSWPDAAWVGLLVYLKLPADPLDRTAAEIPVKRLVQRLWYEAIQGGVPAERKTVFEERDAEYAKTYKEEFTGIKAVAAGRKERGKTSFGRSGETIYKPTEKLKDKKLTFNGQAGVLLEAFRACGFKPMTTAQATDGMVAAGLKTTTKPERIAAFYLCQFVKKSLLERTV